MKISDIFPVPSYLRMPALGLDISDKSLKYTELFYEQKIMKVAGFGTKIIPKGLIESGQIKQKDEFTSFLKNLRKELKNDYVIVSLPEEKAFVGTVKMPLMDKKEIRTALEMQLEEHIPLQAKEVIFDYDILGESLAEKCFNIAFVAVPLTLIECYLDVLKGAGFSPLVFETESHALARALIGEKDNDVYMIIDFGKTRTSFVISRGQKVELTSTIEVAGEALDLALVKALSISPEEAERLKKEHGLFKGKENEKIFATLLATVSLIRNEAERHIAYWRTHSAIRSGSSEDIEKIILCGGDSNLKGFPDYISSELKIPAGLGNPWINIVSFEDYIPKIEFRESLMYATTLGLALRSFYR